MLARTLGFPPVPAEKADTTGRPGRIGAAGLPRGAVPLVAGVLCALAALALLLGPLPPLTDLPGHLARIDILGRLPASPFLAAHFRTDWLVTNLLFDAVTVPLTRLVPAVVAAKLYVALVAALLVSGCVALHRAYHGRASLWPAASAALVYNWPLLYGFVGYVGGIGLALWGAALLKRLERRPLPVRWGAAALAGLLCMVAHAVAFLILAAFLAGAAAARLLDRAVPPRARLAEAAVTLSALLPALGLFAATATGHLAAGGGRPAWHLGYKLLALPAALTAGSPGADLAALLLAALAAALVARAARVRLAPGIALPLAACGLLFLLLPYRYATTYMLDTRVPPALALLAVAAVDVERRPGGRLGPALACLAALFLARVGSVAAQTERYGALVAGYEGAFDRLPAGATLFAARHVRAGTPADLLREEADTGVVYNLFVDVYRTRLREPDHADALAAVGRDVFVANLFAQPGVQPLVVRERFAALRPPREGTRPYPMATAGDLAALVGRLWHLGPEDGPRFLLLQDRLAPGLDLPAGVEVVASGPGFRLLRMPDAASGRPSATATPASPLKAPWQSLP